MPEKKTLERARADKRQGKAPSTQAGEFVREEIEHVREGKHGARSTKQAIAIGLSKARRAGVELPPPPPGKTSERTRKSAARAYEAGHRDGRHRPNARRSKATRRALEREPHATASHAALARQAHEQALHKSPGERSASARRGAKTRLAHTSHAELSRIARKGARTRSRSRSSRSRA
jgi:hypothetical protein